MLSKPVTKRALLVLAGLAFSVLVAAMPRHFASLWNWGGVFAGGVQFGTFIGMTALAAGWIALGPSRLVARVGQSIGGCVVLFVALLFGSSLDGSAGPETPLLFGILAVALALQSILVAGTLSILARPKEIRLRHNHELSPEPQATDHQFGIRELLIATAVAAMLLGAIRWMIQSSSITERTWIRELYGIAFLLLSNVFITMPLLIAPLLRRYAFASTMFALAFVGLVTVVEQSAYLQMERPPSNVQVVVWQQFFWTMNGVQAIWMLLALGILRLGGYRLAAAGNSGPHQAQA